MSIAFVMYKDSLQDELRQLEREVVEGERQLAEQEALIVDLKREKVGCKQASGRTGSDARRSMQPPTGPTTPPLAAAAIGLGIAGTASGSLGSMRLQAGQGSPALPHLHARTPKKGRLG